MRGGKERQGEKERGWAGVEEDTVGRPLWVGWDVSPLCSMSARREDVFNLPFQEPPYGYELCPVPQP